MDTRLLAQELRKNRKLVLMVKVTTSAPRNGITGVLANGTYKIKIKAPREKGKANKELVSFLSKELKVSASNITIESGTTSHYKRIRITL